MELHRFSLLVVVFYIVITQAGVGCGRSSPVKVRISLDKPIWTTSKLYLSLGMDSNLIRNRWQNFDFSSVRLHTLARGLSPAILRLMGTDGDRMTLKGPCGTSLKYKQFQHKKPTLFPNSSFHMTCDDWDKINVFAKQVGWRIMFGMNGQLRQGDTWDSSNAEEILDYSIEKGYSDNLDFELGNEPDSYPYSFSHIINGSQMGHDYITFKKILTGPKYRLYYSNATLAGPGLGTFISTRFLAQFLEVAHEAIDAVTWHQYYGGAGLKYVENATDPNVLDTYPQMAKFVFTVIEQSPRPDIKVWLGETSSTASPVGSNLYETFAAGFMLIDKLGHSAKIGTDLVIRQTFYGFWFALVDLGMFPTPNYWIALLYKQLVGMQVLDLSVGSHSKYVRLYGHCAGSQYPVGAITVYGMNLYDHPISLNLPDELSQKEVHQYLLTPYGVYTGLTAKYIALNGKIILMNEETALPPLQPKILSSGGLLSLPSKSLAYYVVPEANAKGCLL